MMSTPQYPLVVIIYIRSHMHRAEKADSEHTCVTYPLPFNRWGAAPVSVFLCSTSLIPLQGKPFYIQDWESQGEKTKRECPQTREHTHKHFGKNKGSEKKHVVSRFRTASREHGNLNTSARRIQDSHCTHFLVE